MGYTFGIIGCQHAHIGIFIQEMLEAGHVCAGLYEAENDALAEQMCSQHGLKRVASLEELLTDDVQIIGCAAINNEKIDIIELCESKGKHVMVDKPAAVNREGLTRLQAVIDRGRIQVGMLLTERFRDSVYTLRELLREGTLGEVVSITMRKPHRLLPGTRPKWHFSKEQNGGIVIDLFVHDFDLLRWLTDREVEEAGGVVAKTILPEYPDFYDTAAVQAVLEGGIPAQLYADWHNPEKSWTWGDCRIFVTGTKGSVELRLEGDPSAEAKDSLLLMVTHEQPLEKLPLRQPPHNISEDFLSRLEGKPYVLGQEDLFIATRITVETDERVKRHNRCQG